MATVADIARNLDALLRTAEIPDYANALNGIQVETSDDIVKVAAAVDVRERTIQGARDAGANLLLVHHGLFWGGVQPLRGPYLRRIRALLDGRIALYSSHLPLDAHREMGNNALLASELELTPQSGFARHKTTEIGVMGTAAIPTLELLGRVISVRGATRWHRAQQLYRSRPFYARLGDLHWCRCVLRDAARGRRARAGHADRR